MTSNLTNVRQAIAYTIGAIEQLVPLLDGDPSYTTVDQAMIRKLKDNAAGCKSILNCPDDEHAAGPLRQTCCDLIADVDIIRDLGLQRMSFVQEQAARSVIQAAEMLRAYAKPMAPPVQATDASADQQQPTQPLQTHAISRELIKAIDKVDAIAYRDWSGFDTLQRAIVGALANGADLGRMRLESSDAQTRNGQRAIQRWAVTMFRLMDRGMPLLPTSEAFRTGSDEAKVMTPLRQAWMKFREAGPHGLSERQRVMDGVPEHVRAGLLGWIRNASPVGGWLERVLANELVEAGLGADDANAAAWRPIARFLGWYAPAGCWGNRQALAAWAEQIEQVGPFEFPAPEWESAATVDAPAAVGGS